MTSLAKKFFTPAEYLKFEEAALDKHEYLKGIVTERPTCSATHNLMVGKLLMLLAAPLRHNAAYEIFGSDIRLHIQAKKFYTYPDLSVVYGKPKFTRTQPTAVLVNPILIGEIMSAETRAYDRSKKFDLYRALPSVQAYLLVDSEQIYVDYFQKQSDSTWELTEYHQLTDKLALPMLSITIPLADIYARVDWAKKVAPSKKRKA